MIFSVKRDEILHAVNTVQRATATRVIQPILANIMLEATDSNMLKLSATDLDFAIETSLPVSFQREGKTTLGAKKLADILNKLPSGTEVTFEIDEAVQTARIQCGQSVFDMRTLPADEFPTIKKFDDQNYLDVNLKALMKAIAQTVFAAASYDANNVLGGVFFKLDASGLEMAATDGSRLAKRIEPVRDGVPSLQEEISAIIPAKTLQELVKMVGSVDGDMLIRLAIQDGQISFRTEQIYVLSRLLDGQYPKYNQLIPAENKHILYAKKQSFIDSLERAAVMANERTNIVKMAVDNGSLSLAANTPDVGDSKDVMDVLYDGEPLSIAFNYKYVLDALKVIESDDVRMETNGSLSPTIFKGKEENGYLCLVMPVQVK